MSRSGSAAFPPIATRVRSPVRRSLDEHHRALVTLRRLREILISCYHRQVFGERYGRMQTIQGAQ